MGGGGFGVRHWVVALVLVGLKAQKCYYSTNQYLAECSVQHCIVIGNPIDHSKSPDIHHAFARQTGHEICYRRLCCPDDEACFVAVVQAFFYGGGLGANVTLPFKEMAYRLCADRGCLSDEAYRAGAVNTLAWRDGKLYGDNTDGKGLVYDLNRLLASCGEQLAGKSLLILGAGGATRGAILPLLQSKVASIAIANRTYSKAVNLCASFQDCQDKLTALSFDELQIDELQACHFDVIINATSATTTNQTLQLPKTLHTRFAYDMMYGKPSAFLQHFATQGAVVSDGLGMLLAQAAYAFDLWTGVGVDRLDMGVVFA